jgi:RNA polymerase-binding transcription factor
MTVKRKAVGRSELFAKAFEYLTDIRTALIDEIESELRSEQARNREDCSDSYDLASEEHHRQLSEILTQRERVKLSQIDAALKQIRELKYGVCETCGLPIAQERLEAMLFTRLCRDCQHDREREAKTRRPNHDDLGLLFDSGSSTVDEKGN